VTDHTVGDRVLAGTRFGGQVSLLTVPAEQALPLPAHITFEEGAAFPVNYGTAYAALVIMGSLRKGDRVLVHAAAGGVGISATQIAKGIGAEIFGTASAGKHDAILEQGVQHAIDYRTQDFAEEVMRITDGEGVDLVIDATGPSKFKKDYGVLRQGGRLVMYGLSEVMDEKGRNIRKVVGAGIKAPFATMPWWKGLYAMNENKGVFGLNMLHWWDEEGSLDRVTEPLMPALESGELKPVVAKSFPFEEAGEAHRFIAERRNIGKVVLVP
jgi:NADPH:quinone reductase-like Zn-dependent oxidoreductase